MNIPIDPRPDTSLRAKGSFLSLQIPLSWLLTLLAALLGSSQLLLWRFLDIAAAGVYWLGMAGLLTIVCAFVSIMRGISSAVDSCPTIRDFLICFLVAVVLLSLGGEGRFFYANIDWQVRNAVLRDVGLNGWPFVYTARPIPDVLRAPIGMFLLPALAIKAVSLRAGEIALLLQNSAFLAILLSLGSQLFATGRQRLAALTIFLAFSGLDIAGQLLLHHTLADHLESWGYIQYSSHVTMAFWVPQHALAGWTAATLFLLWRVNRIPLALFLTIVPFTALWSPFGVLGILPFAAMAIISTLRQSRMKIEDVLLPCIACLICLPGFVYLTAAGDDVGLRAYPINFLRYFVFLCVEIAPYLIPLGLLALRDKRLVAMLIPVAICLLIMPFIQIGWSIDFMMRASIPALAILAITVAQVLTSDANPDTRFARVWLLIALVIGSTTGFSEIRRAFQHPAAPAVTCTFFNAWDQSFGAYPKGSYLAPLPKMAAMVRPRNPARVSTKEPRRCWEGDWYRPPET